MRDTTNPEPRAAAARFAHRPTDWTRAERFYSPARSRWFTERRVRPSDDSVRPSVRRHRPSIPSSASTGVVDGARIVNVIVIIIIIRFGSVRFGFRPPSAAVAETGKKGKESRHRSVISPDRDD